MTFPDLVDSYRMTCSACPTQYEGTLRDGRRFYFRYRSGRAQLGYGRTDDEAVADSLGRDGLIIGDYLDGCMDEPEFRRVFVELHTARKDTQCR